MYTSTGSTWGNKPFRSATDYDTYWDIGLCSNHMLALYFCTYEVDNDSFWNLTKPHIHNTFNRLFCFLQGMLLFSNK